VKPRRPCHAIRRGRLPAKPGYARGGRIAGIPLLSTARTLRQKRMAIAHDGTSQASRVTIRSSLTLNLTPGHSGLVIALGPRVEAGGERPTHADTFGRLAVGAPDDHHVASAIWRGPRPPHHGHRQHHHQQGQPRQGPPEWLHEVPLECSATSALCASCDGRVCRGDSDDPGAAASANPTPREAAPGARK